MSGTPEHGRFIGSTDMLGERGRSGRLHDSPTRVAWMRPCPNNLPGHQLVDDLAVDIKEAVFAPERTIYSHPRSHKPEMING